MHNNKGIHNPFFGRHHTDETKAKMRQAKTQMTDEVREKYRQASLGHYHSEETKKKISQLGVGRHFSIESKKKISQALAGRVKTEEHKIKISQRLKEIGIYPGQCLKTKAEKALFEHKRSLGVSRTLKPTGTIFHQKNEML